MAVERHINSPDIAYVRVMSQVGRERSVTLFEWVTEFIGHVAVRP